MCRCNCRIAIVFSIATSRVIFSHGAQWRRTFRYLGGYFGACRHHQRYARPGRSHAAGRAHARKPAKSNACCIAATSARWRWSSYSPPGRRISCSAIAIPTQRLLRSAIQRAGQDCHGQFGDLEFDGVRIALLHSHDRRRFRGVDRQRRLRLVCYGHTHVAAIDRRGETLVVNPGAIYRANPHSIAVLDLPAVEATIIEL